MDAPTHPHPQQKCHQASQAQEALDPTIAGRTHPRLCPQRLESRHHDDKPAGRSAHSTSMALLRQQEDPYPRARLIPWNVRLKRGRWDNPGVLSLSMIRRHPDVFTTERLLLTVYPVAVL